MTGETARKTETLSNQSPSRRRSERRPTTQRLNKNRPQDNELNDTEPPDHESQHIELPNTEAPSEPAAESSEHPSRTPGQVPTDPLSTRPTELKAPPQPAGFKVVQQNQAKPLRECVRNALRNYLHNMDGHDINDLYRLVLDEVERPLVETVMENTNNNQSVAARMLGLSRGTLRKKLKAFDQD